MLRQLRTSVWEITVHRRRFLVAQQDGSWRLHGTDASSRAFLRGHALRDERFLRRRDAILAVQHAPVSTEPDIDALAAILS